MNDKPNIELVRKSDESPDISEITRELEQAQTDNDHYYQRMERARHVWFSKWHGQFQDGRKHRIAESGDDDIEPFPWDGSSDSRLRTVCELIRDHVSVAKFAFWNAKIQAKSLRPLTDDGRDSSKATKLLRWRLYNHMKPELMRELPLYWGYKYGYGVGILSVEWDQQRRLEYKTIRLDDIDQFVQASGGDPVLTMLVDALNDPAQEDEVATFVQGLSPILTKNQALKIARELRTDREAQFPFAYPYINKPRWTACRPCIDVIFPSEACDIQQERFVSRREWVTEADLFDRIETDNYDPGFVEEAVKHKGETIIYQWEWWHKYPDKSFRDLIEIHHFYYRAITMGTPCIYKTVFQPLMQNVKPNTKEPLFATHGVFEYDHGQYPFIIGRRTYEDPAILKSIGIAEESYTDEQDIKVQQDGLTDRTSIILQPPMIVPHSRVNVIKNTPLPRAVIGSSRPNEINWMPSPPFDETPIQVMRMVMKRLSNRYGLFSDPEDPIDQNKVHIRQQETADDTLNEIELALEQTFQLMQQFEVDDEVTKVVGQLARPFKVSREEIQGKHSISATINMRMLDEDYATSRMQLLGQMIPFKQEGKLFHMAANLVDPDMADDLEQDQTSPEAQEREKNDERNAFAQMMNGIEPPKPIMGNHQLRLQTMTEIAQQPNMQQRIMEKKDTLELLKNRAEFFQNQIQQFTQNPQIGRALSTKTFQKQMAPEMQTLPAQ